MMVAVVLLSFPYQAETFHYPDEIFHYPKKRFHDSPEVTERVIKAVKPAPNLREALFQF
jgi:hypothetical protein